MRDSSLAGRHRAQTAFASRVHPHALGQTSEQVIPDRYFCLHGGKQQQLGGSSRTDEKEEDESAVVSCHG